MHTREFHSAQIAFQYNGDLSGDVVIQRTDDSKQSVTVPARVLLQFVAERVSEQRATALAGASLEEILGLPHRIER